MNPQPQPPRNRTAAPPRTEFWLTELSATSLYLSCSVLRCTPPRSTSAPRDAHATSGRSQRRVLNPWARARPARGRALACHHRMLLISALLPHVGGCFRPPKPSPPDAPRARSRSACAVGTLLARCWHAVGARARRNSVHPPLAFAFDHLGGVHITPGSNLYKLITPGFTFYFRLSQDADQANRPPAACPHPRP